VTHLTDGTTRTLSVTGRICRSSAGTEHVEETYPSTTPDQPATILTIILDHEHHATITLNSRLKIADLRQLPLNSEYTIQIPYASPANHNPEEYTLAGVSIGVKSLGTRMDGDRTLSGTHRTYTVPAGLAGNNQPIVRTADIWVDQTLQITVSEEDSDPRSDEISFHLTNIRTDEPDPALFTIPAGYKIRATFRN